MHTKESMIHDLSAIGINPDDTLLVHSSMKAIGEAEGGNEIVVNFVGERTSNISAIITALYFAAAAVVLAIIGFSRRKMQE